MDTFETERKLPNRIKLTSPVCYFIVVVKVSKLYGLQLIINSVEIVYIARHDVKCFYSIAK